MRLYPPDGPHSEPVEAGGTDPAILPVVVFEPIVNLLYVLVPVVVVGRWGPIGLKPDKFGRVEDGRNDQLILGMRMPDILLVNRLLQVNKPLDYSVPRGPPKQVVQPSSDKDPHGPGLLLVVHCEGMSQVRDIPTGYGHPVNMKRVWGTCDSWVPGLMEIVEVACPQDHIEPVVREGGVHGFAGGAHVVQVAVAVLHTLQNADLSGG